MWQWVAGGLINGTKLFVGSGLIDDDSPSNSMVHGLKRYLKIRILVPEKQLHEIVVEK